MLCAFLKDMAIFWFPASEVYRLIGFATRGEKAIQIQSQRSTQCAVRYAAAFPAIFCLFHLVAEHRLCFLDSVAFTCRRVRDKADLMG